MIVLRFGMQGEDILEQARASAICVHFSILVDHCVS